MHFCSFLQFWVPKIIIFGDFWGFLAFLATGQKCQNGKNSVFTVFSGSYWGTKYNIFGCFWSSADHHFGRFSTSSTKIDLSILEFLRISIFEICKNSVGDVFIDLCYGIATLVSFRYTYVFGIAIVILQKGEFVF